MSSIPANRRSERLSGNPNRIPEGEQTLPPRGTVDEREPFRVPSHNSISPSVACAAGLVPAATMSSMPASRRSERPQDNPIRISEGEQTLPPRGTVDEREPFRVPSHNSVSPLDHVPYHVHHGT